MNRSERRRLNKAARREGAGDAVFIGATLQQALGLLQSGEPRQALRLYRQVLAIRPDHADALNLSGIARFQLGEVERAIKLIRKAVVSDPGHVDAHNNLGNLLKAAGRLDAAEVAYRRCLEIRPDYVGGHFNLGIVLEALDRPGEAEAAYAHALEIEPGFAEAGFNHGTVLQALGRLDDAVAAYRKALAAVPDHADGHNNLGSAWREMGRLDDAAAAYRRAIEIEPRHLDAHYNLGIVLQEQDRLDEAIAAYRKALEIDPGFAGAFVNLGYALQKSGWPDAAIGAYRRAIEIAPDYPGAQVNLGDALVERGQAKAAAEACDAYLTGHPGDVSLTAWRAILHREMGEAHAARRLVDFDRFLTPVRLEAPAGFDGMDAFNDALAEHAIGHPSLVTAPTRHATRLGKHSGELLAEPKGPVAELEGKIREAVEAYMAALPAGPAHPFLDSRPKRFGLAAWCVILEGPGHQVPHIHPRAWLSGVYYVRVPAVVAQLGRDHAGWIEFGRPPDHFHLAAEPELEYVRPEPGLMLLFPSYFYHRTVPAEAPGTRISIAFDVLPEG